MLLYGHIYLDSRGHPHCWMVIFTLAVRAAHIVGWLYLPWQWGTPMLLDGYIYLGSRGLPCYWVDIFTLAVGDPQIR